MNPEFVEIWKEWGLYVSTTRRGSSVIYEKKEAGLKFTKDELEELLEEIKIEIVDNKKFYDFIELRERLKVSDICVNVGGTIYNDAFEKKNFFQFLSVFQAENETNFVKDELKMEQNEDIFLENGELNTYKIKKTASEKEAINYANQIIKRELEKISGSIEESQAMKRLEAKIREGLKNI